MLETELVIKILVYNSRHMHWSSRRSGQF